MIHNWEVKIVKKVMIKGVKASSEENFNLTKSLVLNVECSTLFQVVQLFCDELSDLRVVSG